jgi:hypothetical protein
VNALIPRIAIRRVSQTPDEPSDFVKRFSYGDLTSASELEMQARGHGEYSLMMVLNDGQNPMGLGSYSARAVEIPPSQRRYKAGTISSLTDLEKASLIVYFARVFRAKEVNDLLSNSRLSNFVLDVDGNYFRCNSEQLQKIETRRYPLAYKCDLASGR